MEVNDDVNSDDCNHPTALDDYEMPPDPSEESHDSPQETESESNSDSENVSLARNRGSVGRAAGALSGLAVDDNDDVSPLSDIPNQVGSNDQQLIHLNSALTDTRGKLSSVQKSLKKEIKKNEALKTVVSTNDTKAASNDAKKTETIVQPRATVSAKDRTYRSVLNNQTKRYNLMLKEKDNDFNDYSKTKTALISDLRKQITNLEKEKKTLSDQIDEKVINNKRAKDQVECVKSQFILIKKANDEYKKTISALIDEKKSLKKALSKHDDKQRQHNEKMIELQTALVEKNTGYEKAKAECKKEEMGKRHQSKIDQMEKQDELRTKQLKEREEAKKKSIENKKKEVLNEAEEQAHKIGVVADQLSKTNNVAQHGGKCPTMKEATTDEVIVLFC